MQPVEVSERPAVQSRILAAARRQFEAYGYRRAAVSDIAREAGIVPGTVYRYFRNKEDLFREVVRASNREWTDLARRLLAEPGSGAERLARLAPASVAYYRKQSLIAAIFRRDAEMLFAPIIEEVRKDVLDLTVGMMADVIRDGIKDGSIRELDPERAAYVMFIGGQTLFNETDYDYADVLPLYADMIQNGMLPR